MRPIAHTEGAVPVTSTPRSSATRSKAAGAGTLRIGDDPNAIRFIARWQANPLKAIDELVEYRIEAHARTVTITRGQAHGEPSLAVQDDGDGVPGDGEGVPDFTYVATPLCDSLQRRLKTDGAGAGLQGEFGIGLLSFWTAGDALTVIATGSDQRAEQRLRSRVIRAMP